MSSLKFPKTWLILSAENLFTFSVTWFERFQYKNIFNVNFFNLSAPVTSFLSRNSCENNCASGTKKWLFLLFFISSFQSQRLYRRPKLSKRIFFMAIISFMTEVPIIQKPVHQRWKTMGWFLYGGDLRHERVKVFLCQILLCNIIIWLKDTRRVKAH